MNDGIAAPFVTLSLAVAVAEETAGDQNWLIVSAEEIALAIVVAIVVGGLGGRFTSEARRRGWASQASESLAVVALAIFAYAGATAVGGNGFVAALGPGSPSARRLHARSRPSSSRSRSDWLRHTSCGCCSESHSSVRSSPGFDAALIGYALLSLTMVRMVPVTISLVGARLRPDTIALIGWFGPRGLASVVFLFVALDELGPAHPATDTLVRAVTWTVLLSVFLHGLSARPVGAWYGRRVARAAADDWERGGADEPRISRRHSWARPPSEAD